MVTYLLGRDVRPVDDDNPALFSRDFVVLLHLRLTLPSQLLPAACSGTKIVPLGTALNPLTLAVQLHAKIDGGTAAST
jgi:hypothetical protein